MKIDSYDFGQITVAGKTYSSDVIIFPERVLSNWWRKEGHSLCLEDIDEVLKYEPQVLVIGTGYSGAMRVPPEVIKEIEAKGIEVTVQSTRQAWQTYNQLAKDKKAVAAFHLTC